MPVDLRSFAQDLPEHAAQLGQVSALDERLGRLLLLKILRVLAQD